MIEQRIILAGINHKNTNLAEREILQLSREEIIQAYRILQKSSRIEEAVILVTCNRIEFYLVALQDLDIIDILSKVFKKVKRIDIHNFIPKFYFQRSSTAAKHLFKVVSGMDSMILGENQIQGQVKDAYSLACSVNMPGKYLHKLFHLAFRTGKRVRSDTSISQGAVSVSGAAIDIIKELVPDFRDKTVLIVGINSMTQIACKFFAAQPLKKLIIANRTLSKAQAMAAGVKATAISLSNLYSHSGDCDIVFSCTGKEGYIFEYPGNQSPYPFRKTPPAFLIDLAIPRDINPSFRDLNGHILIDQDYIHSFIRRNQQSRLAAFSAAEEIIREEVDRYMDWIREIQLSPIFERVTREVEDIRRKELELALSGKLNGNQAEVYDILSKRLSNRIRKIWINQLRGWIHSQPLPNEGESESKQDNQ